MWENLNARTVPMVLSGGAVNVCFICLFVMAIVRVFFPFLDQGKPSLVNFRHHGHRLNFKNGRIDYLDVSWVLPVELCCI